MVGFIPVYESCVSLARYFRCIVADLTEKARPDVVHGEPEVVREPSKIGEKSDTDVKML